MDRNKSTEPAFVKTQNCMDGTHRADLETYGESEAHTLTGQPLP